MNIRMMNSMAGLLATLLFGGAAWAQKEYNTISGGADRYLMLRGKDAVSYFTQPAPVMGNPAIKAEHDGVTYRFNRSRWRNPVAHYKTNRELAAEYEQYLARKKPQ